MSDQQNRAKAIFDQAIEIPTPEDRLTFLEKECGHDPGLMALVQGLLNAHEEAGSFLESPPPGMDATLDMPTISERPGDAIGPYSLLQQIGEGGMGVVYMADQKRPVKRKVALKIIKPGMDTRQVVARFEAERQTLAMMDHPNIARVLDGGSTDSGRPYFVMELVKGMPITKYCDEQRLPTRKRLDLFISVCQAVQHAHQKGIIHRDLKPSNVLVAEYDDLPVAKVIDFGVAKATNQLLTEKTMFTEYGQIVGTIEYMSPEQAKVNQLDVDTRSDVYSLGVLLYELLTGETPFDKKRLRSAAYEEMLQIIREEEPPKPSTRLSSNEALPTISVNRSVEPAKLNAIVRGELDWIVMRALEKDRTRRYETASNFAADIERYLKDEPVEACPPSTVYKLQKFTRRNKVSLITTALVAVSLLLGTTLSIWQAFEANNARLLAEKSKNLADVRLELANTRLENETKARKEASEQRELAKSHFQKSLDAIDQMLVRVGNKDLQGIPQMEQVQRRLLRDALEFYEDLLKDEPDNPSLRFKTAVAMSSAGKKSTLLMPDESDHSLSHKENEMQAAAIEMMEQLNEEFPSNLAYQVSLASLYNSYAWIEVWAQPTVGEFYFRKAITVYESLVSEHPARDGYRMGLASQYFGLGASLTKQSRAKEALPILEKAIQTINTLKEPKARRFKMASIQHEMARAYYQYHNGQEAIKAINKSISIQHEILKANPNMFEGKHHLAERYNLQGRLLKDSKDYLKAEEAFLQAVTLGKETVRNFPDIPSYTHPISHGFEGLLNLYKETGRTDDLETFIEQWNPQTAPEFDARGNLYWKANMKEKALADYDQALKTLPGRASWHIHRALAHLHFQNYDQALADIAKAVDTDSSDGGNLNWIPPEDVASCPDKAFRDGILDLADKAVANADSANVRFGRARLLAAFGQEENAIADCTKAIELAPKNPASYNIRGRVYSAIGDYEKAIADFTKAIELNPRATVPYINRGSHYKHLQQPEKALADYTKAIELNPIDAIAYNNRAILYKDLQQHEKALADYTKAIELNPKLSNAYNNLAWELATNLNPGFRNPTQAVKFAKKAVELFPEGEGYFNTLGVAQYRVEQWQAAIESLEKSEELSKGVFLSFNGFFLAMAHWQLDQKEKALEWYDKSVEWMDNKHPDDKELIRFRAEAEELLGVKEETDKTKPQTENSEKKKAPTGLEETAP